MKTKEEIKEVISKMIQAVCYETWKDIILGGEDISDFEKIIEDFIGSPSVVDSGLTRTEQFKKEFKEFLEKWGAEIEIEENYRRYESDPTIEVYLSAVSEDDVTIDLGKRFP